MIKMPLPVRTAGELYSHCISGKIQLERQTRLATLQNTVVEADASYHAAGQASELYAVQEAVLPHDIPRKDVTNVYHQRFVAKKSLGRDIYDEMILAKSTNRICPLCGIGTVDTLDHYLPESFWQFIVTPRNLVPACLRCNKAKLDHRPNSFESQTIHPYYDDFQSHTWLQATVVEGSPPGITYNVANLENWDEPKFQRAKKHFLELDHSSLFISNAADEITRSRDRFLDLSQKGGSASVRAYLAEELKYCSRKNDWKTALYSALSQSDWFCEEGCLLIGV